MVIPSEIISFIDSLYYDKDYFHPDWTNPFMVVGDPIDGRDFRGKWYIAEVTKHKKANEAIPEEAKLDEKQEKNRDELVKLEGFHLHFLEWAEKWDEWIFISNDDKKICFCKGQCETARRAANMHRFTLPYTQSE